MLFSKESKMKILLNLSPFIFLVVAAGISDVQGFAFSSQTIALRARFDQPSSGFLRLKQLRSSPEPNVINKRNYSGAQNKINKYQGIFKKTLNQFTAKLFRCWFKSRRSILAFCAVFVFWFGAAGTHAPVSHGSSAPSTTTVVQVSRNNILSPSLDQIVDSYVKDHMFDDDVYDPVESIYREAMDDRLKGTYPKDLREATSSVIGQNVIKADKQESGRGVGEMLMKSASFLRRQGLSEMQAIAVIAGSLVAGFPMVVVSIFMIIANQNKRSMKRVMKDRYGDTYSVQAIQKIEEDENEEDDDDDVPDDDEDNDDKN